MEIVGDPDHILEASARLAPECFPRLRVHDPRDLTVHEGFSAVTVL